MIESRENCGGLHYGTPRGECPYPKREGPLVKLLEEVLTTDPKQPATCENCGGSGYIGRDGEQTCPDCRGAQPGDLQMPPAQESEVERARKAAQAARRAWSGTMFSVYGRPLDKHTRLVRDAECEMGARIDALADLAKRLERERDEALAAQPMRQLFRLQDALPVESHIGVASGWNVAVSCVIEYTERLRKERDEARRLHDEHCMGRLDPDGAPAEQPTCNPPWRPR